jgi:murein DD-endopeptidase MepM/ murein hydrolase activator NlpD
MRPLVFPALALSVFALLIVKPTTAQSQNAQSSSPNCKAVVAVVPGACLGPFQHGTLVRKTGSGNDEQLNLASNHATGVLLTHSGSDLVADCGTPVYALADGVVVDTISEKTDRDWTYLGYMVRIKHPATATGLPLPSVQMVETETQYLHMQEPPLVQVGNVVLKGTQLGKVGHTGAAWGCHTHFEVRHFSGRYMADPSWNSPRNIYGKGDQTSGKLFKEKWSDPVPLLSKLPETLQATSPLSLEFSVKATIRDAPPLSNSYVDIGACPGEGCRYGSVWTINAATPVHPARGSAQTAFVLSKGQKITTLTGVVVTKPGRIRILHPIVIAGQQPISSGEIYVLTYRGEGFWKVWLNGKLIDAVLIPEVLLPMTCDASDAPCREKFEAKWISGPVMGQMEALPEPVWWIQMKDATGRTGWIQDTGPTWSSVHGDF